MDRRRTVLLGILMACLVMAVPQVAIAANAYGQTFAGQSKCLECHSDVIGRGQVPSYTVTAHGQFVTDVEANPSALVPASAWWPSPTFGTGLRFSAREIKWMLGAPGVLKEYVTVFRNDATRVIDSGQSVVPTIAGPADDYLMINGSEWSPALKMWETPTAATVRPYFQGCGGCHFLGVTRPSKVTTTLASGATMSPSTPTSYTGQGIQCEHCHGTGAPGEHHTSGVSVVRTKGAMRSEICGQCHVNGTAKEPNYLGKTFSGPNGYTPDRKLEDFYNVAAIQYRKNSRDASQPVIPVNDTKVYPNGSNKAMHHSYYNEWVLSAHGRSFKYKNGDLWTARAQESCLRCHSGEGFLENIAYGANQAGQKWNDLAFGGSSLASDTLNIECAVCHTVHQTGGESLGLRMEAEELCSRCHNGELEEGTEAKPGAKLHHTQAEMRQGFGLIGVPRPATRFMAETGCPSCHMPTTYENRVSHSFKVMTPGNAATWKVQAGGDSCTPCHSSLSRGELQSSLDEWDDELTALTAEANTAIATAKSRPASTTPEGKDLIGSASTNVSYVAADGSKGAHNFPYAKAGLEKAAYFARSVGAGFPRFGATPYDAATRMSMLYGTLAFGDGAPAAGEKLTIQAKPAGTSSWVDLGKATVGEDGDFGFAVGPTGITAYRAMWSPKSGIWVASSAATVNVGSSTSAAVSSARIPLGRTTTIRGAVSPNHVGCSVTVQYRVGSGAWRKLGTRTLTSASAYSWTWKPTSRGSYSVRTVFSGDASHTGSVSAVRAVKVY